MASPKIEVFALFNPTTGAPVTGATPTFTTYKNSDGTNLAQPTITEIGGGFYKFTVTFSDVTKGIVYIVTSGTSRQWRYARPEDWNDDGIPDIATDVDGIVSDISGIETNAATAAAASAIIRKFQTNRWKVVANQLIVYDDDGTTPYVTFNLFDENGAPTTTKIFERVPV